MFNQGQHVRWTFFRQNTTGIIERVGTDGAAPEVPYFLDNPDNRPVYLVALTDDDGNKNGDFYMTLGDDLRDDTATPGAEATPPPSVAYAPPPAPETPPPADEGEDQHA